ncbi:hypothetical protein FD755_010984 [Muntiacus reevesi]|uniref:Uncharacterized protein n=1 Tax=Muntiacus reevesi TaxID=9886 RepID=A0A5N3XRI8_MUNRE|nr:hypothetical protein FD755_010984 [Muntiacus reevesi]
MAFCASHYCCSVLTGTVTTICSSDKRCPSGLSLPSTCPHTVWLVEPTCCLETIKLASFTQPWDEPSIPSCC